MRNRILQQTARAMRASVSRVPTVLVLGAAVLAVVGCQERIENRGLPVLGYSQPAIPHPVVERDLEEIADSGTLRVITFYNSSSYFIHKGGQAGFHYELIQRFARQRGLALEIVIPEAGDDPVSLLNSGRGDVVCAGLAPDESLENWITWTRPTNFVTKVVVVRGDENSAITLPDLAGRTLTLPAGDPFRSDLQLIREQSRVGFIINMGKSQAEAEELLAQVSRGEIDGAVVDNIVAQAAQAYLPDLHIAIELGEARPTVWWLRQNNPDLKEALDGYLKSHLNVTLEGRPRRSATYGTIYDRYFKNPTTIQIFAKANDRLDKSGRISEYDDLIRNHAERAGLDWRMVAALIYQESRFYPYARSKADARGLMQVLPQFAGPQADSLYHPAANMRAGLRLMRATYRSYAYLDSLDRWRFTLAEYHAGIGHLTDARRMAMDAGMDPNRWQGSLTVTLPRLMQRRYFQKTRHGFYGGAETVSYVEEIVNRYRQYTNFVSRDAADRKEPIRLPEWDPNAEDVPEPMPAQPPPR